MVGVGKVLPSPTLMANAPDKIDPETLAVLSSMAFRETTSLVEQMWDNLDSWAIKQLIQSENEERRVYLKAYCQVVHHMRKQLNLEKSKIGKKASGRIAH